MARQPAPWPRRPHRSTQVGYLPNLGWLSQSWLSQANSPESRRPATAFAPIAPARPRMRQPNMPPRCNAARPSRLPQATTGVV
ncbi:hypothetical protein SAMN04487769_1716 [Burkholderia sp. b14]|nr:hypothetical protein SAMN04487769_1716 [Burkholderia sp. b14]